MNALLDGTYGSRQANPTTATGSCSYVFDMMIKSEHKNYPETFATSEDLEFIRCRVVSSNPFHAYHNFIAMPGILPRLVFV